MYRLLQQCVHGFKMVLRPTAAATRFSIGFIHGWFHGSAEERWSLTGKLLLTCARLTADG